MHARMRYIIVL